MQPRSEDPRIEKVARALCAAHGRDPNGEHSTGRTVTRQLANGYEHGPEMVPNWMEYVDRAIEYVAAHDALR